MRKSQLLVAGMCACLLAPAASMAAQDTSSSSSMSGSMGNQDQMFVNMAAQTGQEEVKAGQMAESKSDNPSIKQFAKQMVADHTVANEKLMHLVKGTSGITMPTDFDQMHQQDVDQLRNAGSGASFDQAYLAGQVKGHQEAITAFQQEASMGSDPQLKAFATQNLPLLQQHMAEVKSLQGQMPGGTASSMGTSGSMGGQPGSSQQ